MAPLTSVTRAPWHPALRGVVELLWLAPGRGDGGRERVIPSGGAHLAWRVGAELRLGDDQVERHGVLGGARSSSHVHDTVPAWSLGVMVRPGALPRLFGESARALAERHVGLADLCGAEARELQGRLDADPAAGLGHLEAWLVSRLRPDHTPPGLGRALAALEAGLSVEAAARRVGRSPRAVGGWFHDAVGLSPCRWATVRRVQRAMTLAARVSDGTEVASLAGFADHPHLCRDFRAVTGVTMREWRGHVPGQPAHVPIRGTGPRPE